MKKKQLLKESEIRKFMKFANIGALSDGFVNRLTERYDTFNPTLSEIDDEDDDPLADPAVYATDVATDVDADVGDVADTTGDEAGDVLDEPGELDLGPSPEAGGEMGIEQAEQAVQAAVDIMNAGAQAMGLDLNLSTQKGETPDAAPPVDDVPPEVAPEESPVPEPTGAEAGDASGAGGLSLPGEEPEVEEDFVNEITRRVARRLVRAARRRD